jgi:biotin-(acetyl-CoA carboxylase) ligase
MNKKVQDILKRINFIEADIEIQKQILFSIPANDKPEMERIATKIAAQKQEISTLRREIEEIAPDEHQKIVLFENAVNTFRQIAEKRKMKYVQVKQIGEDCTLTLTEGIQTSCLVKACDEDGRWIIITMEGEMREFSPAEVGEKYENNNSIH